MKTITINLLRLFYTKGNPQGDYTLGIMLTKDFKSFVLEDTFNASKIAGVTRIPAGTYELKIRRALTPLTVKHRQAYKDSPWFKTNPDWYHIEVTGIPNYSGVYVHSGNDDSHTLGCLLPNYVFDFTKSDKPASVSLMATDKFYSIVYPVLDGGGKAFIVISDETINP